MKANVELHHLHDLHHKLSKKPLSQDFALKNPTIAKLSLNCLQSHQQMSDTWVVVGASRGIGLELVKQLLDEGKSVIAGVRNPSGAGELSQLIARLSTQERCVVEQCDVTDENSINVSSFAFRTLLNKKNCADFKSIAIRSCNSKSRTERNERDNCRLECRRVEIPESSH